MSLWADKYRPKTLVDLDYHNEMSSNLKNLVSSRDFPHLLIFGPRGAGKRTRIACILRELYGSGADRIRIQQQIFETPSKRKIEISIFSSNYHVEVNPSEVGIYDRVVIQELIKSVADTRPLDQHPFKVVVLQEVDRLSRDAQDALRRTMEKSITSCRLILCSVSTSRLTPAIQSRCLPIRVSAPSSKQIIRVIQNVAKMEGLKLPQELAERVADASAGNLRKALLMLEACKAEQYPFTADQKLIEADWEPFLKETAVLAVREQSQDMLLEVRDRLYELLCHCIPTEIIFRGLLEGFVRNCDNEIKAQICSEAARCEWRCRKGNKAIFHLEEFVTKFMAIYKQYLESAAIDDDF